MDLVLFSSRRKFTAFFTMVFFLISMYLAYILIFRMVARISREEQARKEQKILQVGIRSLNREMELLRENERQMAVYTHDRRHLFRIMQELAAEKNYEELNRLLDQLNDLAKSRCRVRYCENMAVNQVVACYVSEAKKRGIEFQMDLDLPEKLSVDQWEFAVILENLLERALTVCEKMENGIRKICVATKTSLEYYILEVQNTEDDRKSGKWEGSRFGMYQDKEYGNDLRSLAFYAEKNRMAVEYGRRQGMFYVRLMAGRGVLQMEKRKTDV